MPDVYYDAQAVGANNGTSKADAYITMLAAYIAAGFSNKVFGSHTSIETLASDLTFTSPDNQKIISVDFAGSTPPVAADYLKGCKIEGATARDINFSGSAPFSFHGFNFDVGDDMRILAGGARLNDCTIDLNGSGDKINFEGGSLHLNNVNLTAGNIGARIQNATGGYLYWDGGSIDLALTYLLYNFGAADLQMILEGVDLSLIPTLTNAVNSIGSTKLILKGCPLKAGVVLHSGAAFGVDSLIALYGSHSSNIPYFIQEMHQQGSLITETTNVKAGGSSDGTTPISMKLVTGASAVRYTNPLCMELPIMFYASTIGVQTFDVDIMTDGLTLQDDEAFMVASVPGTTIQRDMSDSLPANPLTVPANLPLSAATWDETGIGAAVKQTVSLTVDVKQVGWVEAHICLARPSIEAYFDLKILAGQRQYLAGQAYINGEAGATCDYPVESDVRLGIDYDSANLTGSAAIPGANDVRDGVAVDATVGNIELPTEPQVEIGISYGSLGTEFTGTLLALIATYELPQSVIIEDEEIIIIEGCD